jgi:hypothetical protein
VAVQAIHVNESDNLYDNGYVDGGKIEFLVVLGLNTGLYAC